MMNQTTRALSLVCLSALMSISLRAESPEEKGLAIAKSMDKQETGFVNQVADVTMILKNKHGQESSRSLRIKTLEMEKDGDKSLTIFDSPRDVKGTAFLSFTHAVGPDDQWLFLPALSRVKRISSNNKSGPFMGSEFAYEDISSQEVEKYSYKFIRDEEVLGGPGVVMERYPVDKKSGYTRQIVWVDTTHWRVAKIVFHDRKDKKLKTLEFKGYQQYPNGKWRADEYQMVNHQTGKSTRLLWENIQFGQDLSERDFDQNALKRAR